MAKTSLLRLYIPYFKDFLRKKVSGGVYLEEWKAAKVDVRLGVRAVTNKVHLKFARRGF